jgi:hypothetical protein
MTTFSIFPWYEDAIYDKRIDERIKPYMTGWKVIQRYKGQRVEIPNQWNSSCDIVKYFQVVKTKNDPNNAEEENEIGATIWLGWTGYDHEVEINLFISGKDVKSGANKVNAEILKTGGAYMTLYHDGSRLTNFTKKHWWGITNEDKVWIELT